MNGTYNKRAQVVNKRNHTRMEGRQEGRKEKQRKDEMSGWVFQLNPSYSVLCGLPCCGVFEA